MNATSMVTILDSLQAAKRWSDRSLPHVAEDISLHEIRFRPRLRLRRRARGLRACRRWQQLGARFLERVDGDSLLQRQADLVEAVEEAVLHEGVNPELARLAVS